MTTSAVTTPVELLETTRYRFFRSTLRARSRTRSASSSSSNVRDSGSRPRCRGTRGGAARMPRQ